MTPERLRQIEELYHAVREAPVIERAALLARTDPELRRELESLFTERAGHEFLDSPAIRNAPRLFEDSTATPIAIGDCLGPYRIEGKLGAGGMGEVFLAIDTRLGRAVAIKIADERFSALFEREARAISSLNHPHICTLYDVGPNYLVMELLEGETLAARLKHGLLPVSTVLLWGSQIAAALAEAHRKGIVHRDLKPGNIMIGKSGVKVLDFGLASSGQDVTGNASSIIMGTPAYMAPEQRDGRAANASADIYAFGGVLYEMLTGVRAGPRRRRIVPRKLETIVNGCLEEDPRRRLQSAAELHKQLSAVMPVNRTPWLALGAAMILVLSATGSYFFVHRSPGLTVKDPIVVADFENKTGDPVFDQTLRQGLTVQLQDSPVLSLVSDQRIQQALRRMNLAAGARVTPEISREVCERTASSAVLEGSITGLGSQYVLWLRARNCLTGEVLTQEQAQAGRKEDVLSALSRIAIQIRSRLGESLAVIREHSTPLEQATTSSLEALKAYSAAKVAMYAHGGPASIPDLQRAIAIDPQFAMAHADLGFMWWNMGQTDQGAQQVRIAYALQGSLSDRERRYILMLYDREVTGNLQKELQTLESWAQTYPRDAYAPGIIAGWVAFGTGQYEKGVQAAQRAIQLDPDIPFPYGGVVLHNLYLDRFTQAEDAMRVAARRGVETPELLVLRYYLAFLKDDRAGMEREIARAPGEHSEDWIAHHQALVLARSGRMRQARIMWERAIAFARQAGNSEQAAIYEAAEAVCEAHLGNGPRARERAHAALALARGRDVEYAAAFALALSGDLPESERLAADLRKRFPEDTPVQFEYLPILHAFSALAHHAPRVAVERLQPAIPFDLALPGTAFFARFGALYSAYVRGGAYLEAGHGEEGAAEFQKILSHRGIVLADPVGALAHLQLGRAYAMSGDRARAKDAYRSFLALWKEADPDIPVLKQATAEYARL